ncbi:MAG: ATP-binding domain-containing protein [Anaerolineales bacterium]|jgi:ATP-dependent exoDNAse (exonuclease V) beta subunit
MSRHSSKGLEFPIVAVSEIGSMPADGEHPVSADNLLYAAMTRSTEKPLLTSHRETEFLSQLKQVDQVGIS